MASPTFQSAATLGLTVTQPDGAGTFRVAGLPANLRRIAVKYTLLNGQEIILQTLYWPFQDVANRIPGAHKSARFETNAQLAADPDGGNSLEAVDPLTVCLGNTGWADFSLVPGQNEKRAVYSGAPGARQCYRTGQCKPGDLIGFEWAYVNSQEASAKNYVQYPAGYSFSTTEFIRAYADNGAGVQVEYFFAPLSDGPHPAPSNRAGDAHWRSVARVDVPVAGELPAVQVRKLDGTVSYLGNDINAAFTQQGTFYADILLFRKTTLEVDVVLTPGTYLNANNYILELDGHALNHREASRVLNLVAQNGTIRCTAQGIYGPPTIFIGGLSANLQHWAAPGTTVVLESRELRTTNLNPGLVLFAGGGTFVLTGTTTAPTPAQVEPGTIVVLRGLMASQDIEVTDPAKGYILTDRVLGTRRRLVLSNNNIGHEAV